MNRTINPLVLPDDELTTLQNLLRKGKAPARQLTRARVLPWLHQQKSALQIRDGLGVCTATVYNIKNRYQQKGLSASLEEKPRSGQPRKVTQQVEAHITQIACSQAPDGRTRWTAALINERLAQPIFTLMMSRSVRF